MANNYINLPVEGSGGGGGGGVTSLNGLTGALALAAGQGISVTPIGLTLQISGVNATALLPGIVSTGAQTFAGAKTFTGAISASNLSGTNTGDVTIATANGLSIAGQALSLALSSTSTTGALSSADWNTFSSKQAAGNYITALTGDVTASGPGSVAATIANLAVTNAKIANSTINLTTKVTGVLPIANGGTATSAVPTNGQVLIGNGTGYAVNTLTAGAGISVQNLAGSITIANTSLTASINIDGGTASSVYGGISPIDAGGA